MYVFIGLQGIMKDHGFKTKLSYTVINHNLHCSNPRLGTGLLRSAEPVVVLDIVPVAVLDVLVQ